MESRGHKDLIVYQKAFPESRQLAVGSRIGAWLHEGGHWALGLELDYMKESRGHEDLIMCQKAKG